MNQAFLISETEIKSKWESIVNDAIRIKPQFFNINNHELVLLNTELIKEILKQYKFIAREYIEDDNTVTLSLNVIDIIENAPTRDKAKFMLATSLKQYSEDFYEDFDFWGTAENRKEHIPFVLKAILSDTIDEIIESIVCQN